MKERTTKILDDKDMEFVEILRSLNIPRNVATLIAFLSGIDDQMASSREIEMGTDLRQPEVSAAMRFLRENDWLEEREVEPESRGRPKKVFSLKNGIDSIIEYFEDERTREISEAMKNIQRLRHAIY
jgi:predicted transcriptional regulator